MQSGGLAYFPEVLMRFHCLTLLAGLAVSAQASAQLIRPDSATANSEFSSSYLATNTINGSGLPANFALTDAHANYTTNNHWTTAAGATPGRFITWTFNTPRLLGGIHLWNHRSNNIASNANYEIVLYDLVLFDGPNGTGNTLATFPNRPLLPDTAIAQTSAFPATAGVRSVRLIVRETQNNNSSPFTGLAEVAFAECLGTSTAPSVASANMCFTGSATLTAQVSGSGPFTYSWQWRPEGRLTWYPLTDGVVIDPETNTPVFTASVTITNSVGTSQAVSGGRREIQVTVTSPCMGPLTSNTAVLDISNCNCTDFNNDGLFPDTQDIDDFLNVFAGGPCSNDPDCDDIDFNNDGLFPDTQDIDSFLSIFSGGDCL
jgi:hypothetical protein